MGKKKKIREKQCAKDVDSLRGDDPKVAAALLRAWKSRYPPGDADVAEQEVELMRSRGHCCYAVLQEGVDKQQFEGVSNFLVMPDYVEVAAEALQQLSTFPCYATLMRPEKDLKQQDARRPLGKDAKHSVDTRQTKAEKAGKQSCEKPRAAAAKDRTTRCESARPGPQSSRSENEGKKGGRELWDVAVDKARLELEAEFNYNALCKQGRKLFNMVLVDKTKRLHGKLKAREKWRTKKKATQPDD